MERCCLLRLELLIVSLLMSSNVVCLHGDPVSASKVSLELIRGFHSLPHKVGVGYNLHCVNDYLFTINCSLSISPSANSSDNSRTYWLTIVETYELTKYLCMLTHNNGNYSCSVKTSNPEPGNYFGETFDDTDSYDISLCHNQNNETETCEPVIKEYLPDRNVKPNAPCCLKVSHNLSRHHFTWKSTYEEYSPFMDLPARLIYQLNIYRQVDKQKGGVREIYTESLDFSVESEKLVQDSKYAAKVRSSPNQVTHMGEWSEWSPEVYWTTWPAGDANSAPASLDPGLTKVFVSLCTLVSLLILCYAFVHKWKKSVPIPTPAPYFHSLYSNCKGDFKSWVVTQDKTADVLKDEETLHIDALTECVDVQEEAFQSKFHYQSMVGSAYSNITKTPDCARSLPGIPYNVSTMDAPLAPGSSVNLSLVLSPQPESLAEEDSGCCLCSHMSLESEPPFYCNEYCTLSAFHQSHPAAAE